jgi:hypothetical protein
MAKKSRRARRAVSRAKTSSLSQQQKASVASGTTSTDVRSAPLDVVPEQKAKPQSQGKSPDFSTEYHYVVSDLNRIGILAAALIAGLIALSFLL